MHADPSAKTAFVLTGGGSLGAVQVGMLKALHAAGIVPDLVVGASVGAINAAYFAGAPDAEGIARLERLWSGVRREDVFPFTYMRALACLLGRRDHLAVPDALRAMIEAELPYRQLEQAVLPCHVVATDALDGTEVALSQGDAVTALLASAAVPAVFPLVTVDGRALMDGGVATGTPIAVAVGLGATRVVVLPTGTSCALQAPPHGMLAMALHALNLMTMRQLLADIDRFAARCTLVVVPPLCPLAVHAYDFSQCRDLVARADKATRHWLRDGLPVQDPHWALAPHRHAAR